MANNHTYITFDGTRCALCPNEDTTMLCIHDNGDGSAYYRYIGSPYHIHILDANGEFVGSPIAYIYEDLP